MSKIYTKDNPLKDLLYLIRIFWKEKLMLITLAIILMSVGGIHAYKQPSLYSFSTTIQKSQTSVFNKYKVTNEILGKNNFLFSIDNTSIYKKFIYRASNYRQIISLLENDRLINTRIDGLDDQSKQRMLFDYAKSFQIIDDTKLKNATVSFMWHDANEGLLLFEDLIKKTMEGVKINVITEVKQSSKMINSKIKNKLKNLKDTRVNILELEKIRAEREILILEEQYSIAKDLGLEGSSFDISKGEKYIITEGSSYVTKTSTSSIKDYERGYKAIAKEIEFLKKRSDKDMIKRSVDYITISREIYYLKNETAQNSLNESINILETDKSDDWVDFSILDVNVVKISPEPYKYVFFGLILGLILGVLFVIMRDLISRLRLIK
jgi:LPS O-antigen subunit length determinant protein (WzzB/FepE family)